MKKNTVFTVLIAVMLIAGGCGNAKKKETLSEQSTEAEVKQTPKAAETDPMNDKGVGPITSLSLPDEIDPAMAEAGEKEFVSKCSACHKIEKRFVGPALKGITQRRTPEWIMNMILNPERMVKEDPIAKKLFEEYLSPMANQSLSEEQARSILEYFRTQD